MDGVYPFGWLDVIYYKVKEEGRYVNKAIYTFLTLNCDCTGTDSYKSYHVLDIE
ncbi:hypothetical protein [Moraxella catarrhalis]|uniref:hypothetical protein n=1 Tax=Moraxella veridica TaxID=3344666 RepID=UPI000E1BA1DC